MKIHDTVGFPNPVRVRIALAEKGATEKVTFVPVDVLGGEQREVAEDTMAYVDDVLGNNAYLAGDTFTVADITAFVGLAFADFAKVEIPATL